jgi:hypothetical protein
MFKNKSWETMKSDHRHPGARPLIRLERTLIRAFLVVAVLLVLGAFIGRDGVRVLISLPGTQPGQTSEADSAGSCKPCHAQQVKEWSGNMMAHAPRDPLFNALLAVTTKYTMNLGLDVGEYCLRCHTPSGWLAGRSHELTVEALFGTDLDGVHCDFCHRSLDPLHPDSTAIVRGTVPGYGNGMYVVQMYNQPIRGARGSIAHSVPTVADGFFRRSEFCGVCHDVSNPYLSVSPQTTPPHLQVPVERTYSEWKLSWYASRGEAGTCQACHMPRQPGYASSLPGTRYRLDVASHDFRGGNAFVPRAVADTWEGIDRSAIQEGVARTTWSLRTAAALEVAAGRLDDSVVTLVRVTNHTGHKLPTGFPEGRQVWISVVGKNQNGDIVFESGTYDSVSGALRHDPQLKVYHSVPGISTTLAAALGLPAGPSFHAALNDTMYFDNRIPPRGFRYEAFREHRAEPVGYNYQDGQYWDITRFSMPSDVAGVEVTVYYQIASKEFVEFLRDENVGNPYDWNDWGSKMYQAWRSYGAPLVLAHRSVSVQGTPPQLPPLIDGEIPVEIRLAQNYPNPFNAGTVIEFWVSQPAHVTLALYDLTGKEIGKFVDAQLPAGLHVRYVEGSTLSSGVYFYRLRAGNVSQTKKMLVVR